MGTQPNFLTSRIDKAIVLRQKLLEFGFKSITYCDTNEIGAFDYHYYHLSKDELMDENTSCLGSSNRLDSGEGLSILIRAMDNTSISPNIDGIDIYSENNLDPSIVAQKKAEENRTVFEENKKHYDRAKQFQKILLNKGFNIFEKVEIVDDGIVYTTHYNLLKGNETRLTDSPFLYISRISIKSAAGLDILENWVKQTVISPDPRNI